MSSQRTHYRRLQRIRINNVLRESPYLQPYIRISSKWPSQVAPRNHRFILHPSHSTLHQDHDTSHYSINDDHTDAVPSPSIPNVADLHPNTHPDVLHLQLELSDPPGAPSGSTVPLVSSSQPLAPPNEPAALTETPSTTIVLPAPTSIADASVSKYLNTLKIPEGLYEMWTIIRKNGASNVMMGEILQWYRQEQVKLASTISLQGIPDHIRLPLDYRGAQKLLQLSSVFHVDVFCLCRVCKIWKPRSLFQKPFTVPCDLLLPNVYDDHFIVYQIHEILQLLLPYYKSRIQIGHYKGYSRLEELRQSLEATDDDVFISIGYDGVPFSPSSGISVYPVLATIDGLNGRHTKGSTFIIALWMGSLTTSKPKVHTVFAPIISQLKVLATTPMKWMDHDGSTKHSRVFVSTILTDTVARPTVQCLTQFNGFYGCGWCLHERDKPRMWDYVQPHLQAPKRTNSSLRALLDQFYNDRGEALSPGTALPEGISGRTPFADLHYMDIIKGTSS